jgi:hypothetical protein
MNARKVRLFAEHIALIVRQQGDVLTLSERYNKKRKLGTYHSWPAVERALRRYINNYLATHDDNGDPLPKTRRVAQRPAHVQPCAD